MLQGIHTERHQEDAPSISRAGNVRPEKCESFQQGMRILISQDLPWHTRIVPASTQIRVEDQTALRIFGQRAKALRSNCSTLTSGSPSMFTIISEGEDGNRLILIFKVTEQQNQLLIPCGLSLLTIESLEQSKKAHGQRGRPQSLGQSNPSDGLVPSSTV